MSSSQPIICVPKRTHRASRRTHRVCPKTQWGSVLVFFSETVLSKQYSACFLRTEESHQSAQKPYHGGQNYYNTKHPRTLRKDVFLPSKHLLSEMWRRGHCKRGICIKLSEIDFQIRDKFATILRILPLMYETKYRQLCANLVHNLLVPTLCRADLGWIFHFGPAKFWENCQRISQRILMANFDSEIFGLVFPGFQVTPKSSRPKFTSRIVGIPLQFLFLEPKIYSRRFSAYGRDQNLRQICATPPLWTPPSRNFWF